MLIDMLYDTKAQETQRYKSGFSEKRTRIVLPICPDDHADTEDKKTFHIFMQTLRSQSNSLMSSKVLSAIHSTAQRRQHDVDQVAKVLVDFGLKAPKKAFPQGFVNFCENAIARSINSFKPVPSSIRDLAAHWTKTGETVDVYEYC